MCDRIWQIRGEEVIKIGKSSDVVYGRSLAAPKCTPLLYFPIITVFKHYNPVYVTKGLLSEIFILGSKCQIRSAQSCKGMIAHDKVGDVHVMLG